VHPRLFEFGRLVIPTYGVLVALGVLAGLTLALALARRLGVTHGINPDKLWNLSLIGILAAIVGAKLLLILDNWSAFRAAPVLVLGLTTFRSGGVFLGGFALAFIACLFYALRARLPLLRTMDIAAPAIALGHGIGRMGCLAAGCCYGRPTTLPWGITFHSQFAARTTGVPLGIPLHPTQVYESITEFALCAILLWLFSRRHNDGEIMGFWLFSYGLARFFLEFLRGDAGRGSVFGGALSVTQLLAVLMVIAGGALWLRPRPRPAQPSPLQPAAAPHDEP
jgi:phosphatidylglycerol:prolipoprotein diacylglycerol transferase